MANEALVSAQALIWLDRSLLSTHPEIPSVMRAR